MFRCHLLLTLLVLAFAAADAGQNQPVAKDQFGDPLPPGAVARIGTIRWRHESHVLFAAVLPGGKTVLTADNLSIRVWDFPSGKELRRIGERGAESRTIVHAALTPDGKTLATYAVERAAGKSHTTIHLWDVLTGKEVRALEPENVSLQGLSFSANGEMLAAIGNGGVVHVWDWVPGKQVRKFGDREPFSARSTQLRYGPDGQTLATLSASGLKLWNAASTAELWSIAPDSGSFVACAFSDDGKTLAVASAAGVIALLEAATGKEQRTFYAVGLSADELLFSKDSTKLYAHSAIPGILQEWSVADGKALRKIATGPNPSATTALSLSADGKTLARVGSRNAPQFIDLVAGKETAAFGALDTPAFKMQFTLDGKSVLTLDRNGAIRRADALTGKDLGCITLSDQVAYGLSHDGQVFAVRSQAAPGLITLTDAPGGRALGEIGVDRATLPLIFSPDNKVLAMRSSSAIELYEVPSAKPLQIMPVQTATKSPFSGDDDFGGGFGGGGKAKKGKGIGGNALPPGKGIGKFKGPKDGLDGLPVSPGVTADTMIFSPDGKTLVGYYGRRVLGVWNTTTGLRTGSLTLTDGVELVRGGAFSPDGRYVAVDAGDGIVTLFELLTGQPCRTYGKKAPSTADWTASLTYGKSGPHVAFSTDGKLLVHAGLDDLVHVWDVATAQELTAFKGHRGQVHAVAFAPDGKTLASAGNDTTVLIWNMAKVQRPAIAKNLNRKDIDSSWQALGETDAVLAFTAVCDLTAMPEVAVGLIKEQIKPVAPLDQPRFQKLVAQLNDVKVEVRQHATAALFELGEKALPAIDRELARTPPLEVRRRLQEVRGKLTGPIARGEQFQVVRAVTILENIGTPEARQVLQALAGGAEGALVTTTAQAALKR
jgi:WD40 repeat protein